MELYWKFNFNSFILILWINFWALHKLRRKKKHFNISTFLNSSTMCTWDYWLTPKFPPVDHMCDDYNIIRIGVR